MQKIIPHLWFDTQAKQAAEFYVDAFGADSAIIDVSILRGTPSGDCDLVWFRLRGYEFMAISAGPAFAINPSISFMLNFDPSTDDRAREHLDALWEKLADGGTPLMPINEYPFSKRYGWIRDKFGVSWQLILSRPAGETRPFIVPSMMFTRDRAGKAEEAMDFYMSVFRGSRRGTTVRYPAGMEREKEGTVMFADFMMEGQWFAAMDSADQHDFSFNEAVSLLVRCETQEEIDYYWNALSAVPEAEQCGWLKDEFGVSWQISPTAMTDILSGGDQEKINRAMQAFLTMKKVDLTALKRSIDPART